MICLLLVYSFNKQKIYIFFFFFFLSIFYIYNLVNYIKKRFLSLKIKKYNN